MFRSRKKRSIKKKTLRSVAPEGKKTGLLSSPAPDRTVTQKASEIVRTPVRHGFAKKGDLIAVIHPPISGKDGKNVLGEPIPARRVETPRLIAGRNVKVEKGSSYFMAVDGMVELLKDNRGNYYISGRLYRHGKFEIDLSDDEMEAYLTVIPPLGGARPVTTEMVLDRCASMGITVGMDEEAVRRVVDKANDDKETAERVLIASGEKPVHGSDRVFEYKVRLASGSKLELKEDGRTDFKEYDLITRVKKDDLIAVVTRPKTKMRDGQTVKGETVRAQSGRSVEVSAGRNVRVEEDEEEIRYYSEIDGQLLTRDKGVSVEPLMTVRGDVGPKTGNINFDGTLLIQGNVNDNYEVRAGKDITIQGNVGSASIRSGGNIIVKNGVIGKYKGLISAAGDVTLKFTENTNILAAGDIIIQRAALNCRLVSGGRVISTLEKGQIVGGEIKARGGLEVKILGNESENRMSVHTGIDFLTENRLKEITQKREKYEQSQQKLTLLLDRIKRAEEEQGLLPDRLKTAYEEARKKRAIITLAVDNLKKKEKDCIVRLSEIGDAEVRVLEYLHKGVKVFFGTTSYEPETTKRAVRVYYNREYRRVEVSNL
ncbi:MAG: DUF342 domain-containing protein [Spirochaetes bacterium]|nr:DUF342 domain-containing protein [Spirochaetota bacterium]